MIFFYIFYIRNNKFNLVLETNKYLINSLKFKQSEFFFIN